LHLLNRMQQVTTREIVIARYREDINWIRRLPLSWKITIYNKGADDIPFPLQMQPNITILKLENKGREAETFAYHLLHRYDTLSDFTIFLQASPFDHAPQLMECLSYLHDKKSFNECETFIPLAIRYNSEFPSPHITDNRDNRFFRIEDMSIYTLDYIEHVDTLSAPWVSSQWYLQYNMTTGTNIMKYFFNSIGWEDAISPTDVLIKCSYAACFGVTKAAILQHSHAFYERLYEKTFDKPIAPYILERAWLHIFDQNFDASRVLPEFALHNKVHHQRQLPCVDSSNDTANTAKKEPFPMVNRKVAVNINKGNRRINSLFFMKHRKR
jgi:hypothetical protein